MKLTLCAHGKFSGVNVDFEKTMNVYNLCFWLSDNCAYTYIPWSKSLAVAKVYWSGDYEIYSEICEKDLVEKLKWMLGVHEDLSEFYKIASEDLLLSNFVRAFHGWRLRSSDLWWALIVATCQQNASFKQGWRMIHKFIKVYGKYIYVEDTTLLRPPTPLEVLSEPEKLKIAGLGYRAETILRIAKSIVEEFIRYEDLINLNTREAENLLKRIKGVGSYTARLALILSTRRYELPPIDKWLKRIINIAYGISERGVEEYWVQRWGQWAGLAALAITITLDAEVLSKAVERVKRGLLLPISSVKPSPVNMRGFCEE